MLLPVEWFHSVVEFHPQLLRLSHLTLANFAEGIFLSKRQQELILYSSSDNLKSVQVPEENPSRSLLFIPPGTGRKKKCRFLTSCRFHCTNSLCCTRHCADSEIEPGSYMKRWPASISLHSDEGDPGAHQLPQEGKIISPQLNKEYLLMKSYLSVFSLSFPWQAFSYRP